MKNVANLIDKNKNIIICSKCGFFPMTHELQNCTTDKDIYKIKWSCQNCKEQNICFSDSTFKIYSSHNQFLIDQTTTQQREILLLIDISTNMLEKYVDLPRQFINRKIGQFNKKTMVQESPLLATYLENKIIQNRLKGGRFQNWENVLNQRQLIKIEYALWLADFVKKRIKNMKIQFLDTSQDNQNILKQSTIQIRQLFPTIKMTNLKYNNLPKWIPKTNYIGSLQFSQGLFEIIIISASQLENIQNYGEEIIKKYQNINISLINLQTQIDPITLQLTKTGQYLRTHTIRQIIPSDQQNAQNNIKNKLQIFDIRSLQNVLQRQYAILIQNILSGSNNQICIYTRKIIQTHSQIKHIHMHKLKKSWQKMIQRNQFNSFIRKRLKQTSNQQTRPRIFNNNEKNKSTQILAQFNNLVNKQDRSVQSIKQFINFVHMNVNKNNEIRVYIKLFGYKNNQRIIQTALWNNYKSKYNVIKYDKNNQNTNKTNSDEQFVYVQANISGSGEQYGTISQESNSYSGSSNSSSGCELCNQVKRRAKQNAIVENTDYQYL